MFEYSVLTDGVAKLMLLAPLPINTSPLLPTVVGKFNVIDDDRPACVATVTLAVFPALLNCAPTLVLSTGLALNVLIALIVCARSVMTNAEFAPVSGIVYVRDAAGAGELMVTVLVVPSTNWFVVEVKSVCAEKVLMPLIVCAKSLMTNAELAPVSGIVYVRDAAGAGELMVTVLVVPSTNWFVVAVTRI